MSGLILRSTPLFLASLLFVFFVAGLAAQQKPNVVIIYGDDVGWGDVGAYGSKLIPTPNLDKLASEGLMLTDAHCSAATCTPSRFSMLTGIHGFRHKVRILAPNAPMAIKPQMFTLPKLFKQAGYNTAVVGKWHLGIGDGETPVDWNADVKPGPREVGFDYSFLLPSTNDRVPCVYLENYRVVGLDEADPLYVGKKPAGSTSTEYPDGKTDRSAMTYYESSHGHNQSVINGIGRIGYQWGGQSALWDDETMADVFVEKSKAYLDTQSSEKPFFLFFSSQDIHVPRAPHPRFKGLSKLGFRGDAMVQLDWSAGQIIKALEEKGFADNTIVIFSSDNGPVYDDGYKDGTTVRTSTKEVDRGHDGSGPYRGGKYQIYEGGTRVPMIVKWPGKIAAGKKSSALVSQIDFVASFASMLHIQLADDQSIDSRDAMSALLGEDPTGLPFVLEEARTVAIKKGDWKFIPAPAARSKKKQQKKRNQQVGNRLGELYNLKDDRGEAENVVEAKPEVAAELRELLEKMRQDEGVRLLSKQK